MRSRTPLVVVDKQIIECSHDSTLHKFVYYQSIIHRDQKFHNSGRTVNYRVLYSPPRIPAGIRRNPVNSGQFREFRGMEILAVLPAKIVISVPRNSGGFRNGPGITRTESTGTESTEFFF